MKQSSGNRYATNNGATGAFQMRPIAMTQGKRQGFIPADATVKDIQKRADNIVSDAQEKSEEIMSKLNDMLGKKNEGAEAQSFECIFYKRTLINKGSFFFIMLFFL